MASTDARPLPIKNTAYRLYFDIRKGDGTLITSWTGADSEVSKDGGNYADCTNEATEIQTSGTGYLDLTSTEMNADSVVVKITVTNSGALPVVATLYPNEGGDIDVDVTYIAGAATTAEASLAAEFTLSADTQSTTSIVFANTTHSTQANAFKGCVVQITSSATSNKGERANITASSHTAGKTTCALTSGELKTTPATGDTIAIIGKVASGA